MPQTLSITDPAGSAEQTRLLNRITFGFNRSAAERLEALGYEAYVDWQLDFAAIDDSEFEGHLQAALPTIALDAAELTERAGEPEELQRIYRELLAATLIRQAFSPRQIHERMVEFWSDHFNVTANGGVAALLKAIEDREVIRPLAMDRFDRLLQADARSPAMLFYLDNFNNTADGPNENYARELMELHTLGVDGGYSEADIKEAARIFTGWTIYRRPPRFRFNPFTHDWGDKKVLGRRYAASGESEGTRLLDDLAGRDATARHLATKLARRFVADQPDDELIEAVALSFTDTGGQMVEVLRTLLLHPLARASAAVKLKRPNEFLIGLLRALEAEPQPELLRELFESLAAAGQAPFAWPAPDGYPDHASYWQSTAGFLVRFNTAQSFAQRLQFQSPVLREALRERDPEAQIEQLVSALLPTPLSADQYRILLDYSNGLAAIQRPASVAAWLLSLPDAQWR